MHGGIPNAGTLRAAARARSIRSGGNGASIRVAMARRTLLEEKVRQVTRAPRCWHRCQVAVKARQQQQGRRQRIMAGIEIKRVV